MVANNPERVKRAGRHIIDGIRNRFEKAPGNVDDTVPQ
jgi:hypothetical protein